MAVGITLGNFFIIISNNFNPGQNFRHGWLVGWLVYIPPITTHLVYPTGSGIPSPIPSPLRSDRINAHHHTLNNPNTFVNSANADFPPLTLPRHCPDPPPGIWKFYLKKVISGFFGGLDPPPPPPPSVTKNCHSVSVSVSA